jgi:hypothetical protein
MAAIGYLLTNPMKPDLVKIGLVINTLKMKFILKENY